MSKKNKDIYVENKTFLTPKKVLSTDNLSPP